jgi:hypothetical protein
VPSFQDDVLLLLESVELEMACLFLLPVSLKELELEMASGGERLQYYAEKGLGTLNGVVWCTSK